MAIDIAIKAQEAAEAEIQDLMKDGVVTKIIAGVGCSGTHWWPSIGVHLARYENNGAVEMEKIRARLAGVVPPEVTVNIYPLI